MTGFQISVGCRPRFTRRGRVRLMALVLAVFAGTLTGPVPAGAASRYSDVVDGDVHHGAIEALAGRDVFADTECGEDLFCPDDPIERPTLAVWTIRVLDYDPSPAEESSFTDVDIDEWWASSVERLYETGIMIGCETEPLRYYPDAAVTRGPDGNLPGEGLRPAGRRSGRVHRHRRQRPRSQHRRLRAGRDHRRLQHGPRQLLSRGSGHQGTDGELPVQGTAGRRPQRRPDRPVERPEGQPPLPCSTAASRRCCGSGPLGVPVARQTPGTWNSSPSGTRTG